VRLELAVETVRAWVGRIRPDVVDPVDPQYPAVRMAGFEHDAVLRVIDEYDTVAADARIGAAVELIEALVAAVETSQRQLYTVLVERATVPAEEYRNGRAAAALAADRATRWAKEVQG
jgi:hypothetical protein